MSSKGYIAVIFLTVLIGMQLIKIDIPKKDTNPAQELNTTQNIKAIFERSCYDCHSNKTNLPWYSNIAPVSWIIADHVNSARSWLNFSEWENYDEAKKSKLKKLIYREVADAMPMYIYTLAHKDAKLIDSDKRLIREWTGVKASEVSMRD